MTQTRLNRIRILHIFIIPLVCSLWMYTFSFLFERKGLLFLLPTTQNYMGFFLVSLLVTAPQFLSIAAFAFVLKKNFAPELNFVQTEKVSVTLVVTSVYVFALPLGAAFTPSPEKSVYAWFYYLIFISVPEELIYRDILPHFLEEVKLPTWAIWISTGAIYTLAVSTVPTLMTQGFQPGLVTYLLAHAVLTFGLHCFYLGLQFWSGAMWLPVGVHALLSLLAFLAV